jgi:adenosylhomocysteine nucleosidase
MRRLAVLAASRRELAPVECVFGLFGQRQRDHLGSFPHQVGQVGGCELHLIETGVGPERARQAGERALLALAPDALISTGYAGALGVAAVGEVILGTTVVDWTDEESHPAIQADPDLLSSARLAARNAGIGWTQGPVVTVNNVLWRASEKQALGGVSGAVAVDMESAVIAKVAATAGVPFLMVRAIVDRVGDDLPMDFNLWFLPFGSFRCLLKVVKDPSILYGLYEMKRHANQASKSLRWFFCEWVLVLASQLPPPDAEATLTMGAH